MAEMWQLSPETLANERLSMRIAFTGSSVVYKQTHVVSPPKMPVPLKRMYIHNANIPRAEISTFVPSCPPPPPYVTHHDKA